MTGAERPIGIVFLDDAGNLRVRFGQLERVPRGGRPKATPRHVAMALHFDFLCTFEQRTEADARQEVANMLCYADADRGLRKIIKKVHNGAFRHYPNLLVFSGATPANRAIAYLGRCDDGTVEGYVVRWGSQEAVFGRGTLTFNPGGEPEYVLDLEPNHPAQGPPGG